MITMSFCRHLVCHRCPYKDLKSQSLPLNMAIQTLLVTASFHTKKKLLESQSEKNHNIKHHLKRPAPKPTQNKAPVWLSNVHAQLLKNVNLPASFNDNHIDVDLSSASPTELLMLARSVKSEGHHRDKVVFALCRNFHLMSVEEILTAADVLYINGVLSPVFTKAMVLYLYERIDTLQFTPSHIVRTVFHIQIFSALTSLLLTELEGKMKKSLSEFTINEVAQMCHLLFYKQYRFKSMTLVDEIGKKLLAEFDSLTPENLPMLMKTFRYSNYVKVSFYKKLGDHLVSRKFMWNFSNAGQIMHFAFVFASVRVTHHKLFNHVLQRVQALDKPPRVKDLSKIIWACGTLVTSEKEHLSDIHTIVNMVRKNVTRQQVQRYPDNLMDFFIGLAYLDIYPVDLIERFLGEDTIQALLGMDAVRAKFLQLQFFDASVALECPEFKGNLLSEEQRHEVENHLKHLSMEVDVKLRKPFIPTLEALRDVIGLEHVQSCFVLPHFKTADILLAYDQDKRQFIIPDGSSGGLNTGHVKRIVIMLLSKKQTSYDDQPLGMLQCKLRQLDKLGFSVIQINADEAMDFILMDKTKIQQQLLARVSEVVGHPLANLKESH